MGIIQQENPQKRKTLKEKAKRNKKEVKVKKSEKNQKTNLKIFLKSTL
jgi:hypothetical protein